MQPKEDGAKRPLGLLAFLGNELREAFQDIRQKLVEEGWFGRVTTAAPVIDESRQPAAIEDNPAGFSFDELWSPREHADRVNDVERARELEFDR